MTTTTDKQRPDSGHKYDGVVEDHGFLRFANAYKGAKREDDYTRVRFRFSSILTYEAWDWDKYNEASYEDDRKKNDLGNTAYCICLKYAQGSYGSEARIFFWTEKQRDETLDQLDYMMGLNETSVQPNVTVINPRYDRIPDGSATIQDLPIL